MWYDQSNMDINTNIVLIFLTDIRQSCIGHAAQGQGHQPGGMALNQI